MLVRIGAAQWSSDPTLNNPVCSATGQQYSPVIASDGSGGAIIAWYDYRNGSSNSDIFVQRMSASGTALWTTNGVAISSAVDLQNLPVITSDGSGGAVIAWVDSRSGSETDVYAQRVDGSGVPQWTADGLAISTATGDQSSPLVVSDG
ncbi:MAG TPA: hypothetical protein VNL69_03265, partial [Bacteroidota bacterium]|nr:hypothetical protein [Bacteroidota bacterium]